jgi:hypothetical protein
MAIKLEEFAVSLPGTQISIAQFSIQIKLAPFHCSITVIQHTFEEETHK